MKLINDTLTAKGLKISELSPELKERILGHKEMILKYNMACEEFEQDEEPNPEVEAKLDEQEEFIATNETEIAELVKAYEKPAPAPTPDPVPPAPAPAPAPDPVPPAPAPAPAPDPVPPAPTPDPAPAEKKKGDGVGWLIFAGAVLLVTVGGVNFFKKQ
jgi:hypothetical protein